jgi:hypothetical protein
MVQSNDPVADEAEEIALLADPAPSVVPVADEPMALKPVATPLAFKRTAIKPAARKPSMVGEDRQEADRRSGNVDAIPVPAEIEPERPGRFMRIVAALAREAEERAPAGRTFHQTISRLARSRRMPSLR